MGHLCHTPSTDGDDIEVSRRAVFGHDPRLCQFSNWAVHNLDIGSITHLEIVLLQAWPLRAYEVWSLFRREDVSLLGVIDSLPRLGSPECISSRVCIFRDDCVRIAAQTANHKSQQDRSYSSTNPFSTYKLKPPRFQFSSQTFRRFSSESSNVLRVDRLRGRPLGLCLHALKTCGIWGLE